MEDDRNDKADDRNDYGGLHKIRYATVPPPPRPSPSAQPIARSTARIIALMDAPVKAPLISLDLSVLPWVASLSYTH